MSPKAIRFEFKLPVVESPEFTALMRAAFRLIDLVGSARLSKEGAAKCAVLRKALEDEAYKRSHEARMEAVAAKKAAAIAAERAEYDNLTPEAKRRRDEKDRKLAAKKQSPGMRMKIMR
jgi:hypothetical protein